MARDLNDVKYRGNRRWNGSYGSVWLDGELVFELHSFETKVEANREDVIIGASLDSKVTSLTGKGTLVIKSVINRGIAKCLNEWKKGRDLRFSIVGLIADPDAYDGQKERVSFDNVWFNELDILSFEKGKLVEKEFPFGFTPEDVEFLEKVGD